MKTCNKCLAEKQISDFDSGRSICKSCRLVRQKEWKLKNIERVRSYWASWRSANPDKAREVQRASKIKRYRENPEIFREIGYKKREALANSYIAGLLGVSVPEATPELIEAKREWLINYRLMRELKKVINEKLKENNES